MISNATPYKLKASKSSRDVHDYQENQGDDIYEDESVDGDASGDPSRRSLIYTSRDGRYRGSRSRQADFRHRGGAPERRSYRTRGPHFPRRDDRDYLDGIRYSLTRKYEPLNRHTDPLGTYHRSKCFDSDKKNEIRFNLPEDTRISKLLRRLSNEGDQENSLTISKKLLEVLLIPDNAVYVRKAFHILGDSMLDILHVAPGPLAKQQAARALGRMGYIMGQENDFGRFQDWMFGKLQNETDDIRFLFMKALKESLNFELKKPVLQDYSESLMRELLATIETTENCEVLKATLDILVTLVEIYPEDFYSHFRDTADLLFGWHVDHTQPLSTIEFISNHLQCVSKHFQINMEFSITLIWHFVEDIETYANQLHKKDDTDLNESSESNSIEHLTVSIMALNTVLKCLGDSFYPSNNELVTIPFVSECLTQIVKTVTDALESFVPDNLIIASNKSISLLVGVLGTKTGPSANLIYALIDLQLSLIHEFSDLTIISLLLMISKVVKELSANLPMELIQKLVGPNAEIVKLRYSPFPKVQEATIGVYQALLNLKNIPLLQEAYRFILGDLEAVYRQIVPNVSSLCPNNPFVNTGAIRDPELAALFLLRCLSQVASAGGSIIGLWALKPSILEVIAVLLEPYNEELSKNSPALQYSLFYLLYSHCKNYNHFISSSNLMMGKSENVKQLTLSDSLSVSTTSPNAGNFSMILQLLYKSLSKKTGCEKKLLLLHWLNDIILHSESTLQFLYCTEEFIRVSETLVKCGFSYNDTVVLSVASNLEKLLCNKQLSWNNTFLVSVNELCVLHMNSNNPHVCQSYANLSAHIPWDIAIVELNKLYTVEKAKSKYTDLNTYNNFTITLAQHYHLSGAVYGEMLPLHFKTFMNYLLKNEQFDANWLENIFICCWPLESDCQANMEEFRNLALNSRIILNNWATWEAAQLCVNSKLRTPLGKPNETFMSFESSLKQLARDVIKSKVEGDKDEHAIKCNQKRVRMLLQFMEHLEKSIYNASEGCAIAMLQPGKPVRTFFHTNASTCREWLSRIRIVVIHIALHAGQSTIAVRHGHALLKDLVKSNKAKTIDFDRAVMFVALALLNLRETEALQGLYTWCKVVADKSFLWLKSAADQANKRFELATEGYSKIYEDLKSISETVAKENVENKNTSTDSHINYFITDQIINCYKELNSWVDVVNWQNKEPLLNPNENGVKYSFKTVDETCAQALFDIEVNTHAFNELSTWKHNAIDSWSSYNVLRKTETDLYNIALNIVNPESHSHMERIDKNLLIIQNEIQDNLVALPSEFLQNFSLMHYTANALKNVLNNKLAYSVFLVSENFENEIEKIVSTVLSKILWWAEYFAKIQNQQSTTFCSNLRLDIIKRARKEKNFNLAWVHINKFLEQKDLMPIIENGNQITSLVNVANLIIQKAPEFSTWSIDTARAVKEVIKLLYDMEENKQLTFNLCAAASTGISKNAEFFRLIEMRQISSKILLKLAMWLQNNEQISLTEINSPLGKLLMVLPEINMIENVHSNIIPVNEMAVGKLLQYNVHHCTSLAKSWNAFGTWCYRWGRKIVDHNSDIGNNLTDEDRLIVTEMLPADTKQEDLAKIFTILSQTRASDEEDIDSNDINTSEVIQNQLQNVPALRSAHENQLQTLVHIWQQAQKRVYAYYELSANAYFKYLHLAANSENINNSTECNSITATLRLLRLIVKHALELQNVLEDGLATTPTHPWKVIIPQLFSRLNHPESYVRQRVSELLCRVAQDAPHLITFPAVVGALEGGVKFDFSEISISKDCFSQSVDNNEDAELNELEEAYDSDSEESKNVLQSCFKAMVDTLSNQAPEMITQVQLLVTELRRITLLWDELWLGTLIQHHSEITKRQQQLEQEIEKVNENLNLNDEEKMSLVSEKYRIIIKPVLFILEQLHAVTSVEPETPHEKLFQERYSSTIIEVLEKLKNPDNPDKPQESWQPLKMLHSKFQQKVHKRTTYSLRMQDISPHLASMQDTVIAMPGLICSSKTHVTISSVSNHVSILPTKTKPKKLVFHGSNGQTYTYLFKGLEDLHLDERIMQFLSIANTMMAQISDGTGHNLYRARHYSVIPLGPRSGLISWVDGTTPVFALYKRWQQREAAKANAKNNLIANTTVLRPSELFYNKLNPLLQEHGVKNLDNRKEWPLVVLKQVLTELMNETPNDLLAKELWCYSINTGAWWQMVKNYSYSAAVMSIIGYIIGLGDRHLDNVLVDLTSGEVVHIDYNVCFEKGKTLRVPEKVPFRLTPNIKEALGVTGVEGIFKLACENVLKTMKKGRETLLTLLEAFVYDPLVDWTVGGEGLAGTAFRGVAGNSLTRQSRKDMEREVTLSMFNVRCTEMKIDWDNNRDEIVAELVTLKEKLQYWLEEYSKVNATEDSLQDLHQQMALVKEAEAHGKQHNLYALPSRYKTYRRVQDSLTTAKSDLQDLKLDYKTHVQLYSDACKSLTERHYTQWMVELKNSIGQESVYDLVKEFFQNAGLSNIILQCEQSEKEISQYIKQQTVVASNCLQFLQEYEGILSYFPESYTTTHRLMNFLKWCDMLLESKIDNAPDEVFEEFKAFLDLNKPPHLVQNVIDYCVHMNTVHNDVMRQAAKLFKDSATIPQEYSLLEQMYNEAKLAVTTFLRCEKGASTAFEFVIMNELMILNQSYTTCEIAASRGGEFLIKLTSRHGTWFLDDLAYNSNKAVEFTSNLLLHQNTLIEDTKFVRVVKGLQSANNVYNGLQNLYYTFHTIILPESIKKIQNEEPSVVQMINDLNCLIKSVCTPLPNLVAQLEKHLTCVVMEMDMNSSFLCVLDLVAELKVGFENMLQAQSTELSQGKMLLMGFNGLFNKLIIELNTVVDSLGSLEVPSCWRKLDHVKDAKAIAAPIFNPQVKAIIDDIFLLKRLHTISEFFSLCVEMCNSFKGVTPVTVFNDEQLSKPIKKFIADFISRQFLGVSTECIAYIVCFLLQHLGLNVTNEIEQQDIGAENKVPLDELIRKGWNYFIKEGVFSQNIVTQASSLETNLKTAWENMQTPKRIDQNFTICKYSYERIKNHMTAHIWVHEDIFKQKVLPSISFTRSKFIDDLNQELETLNSLQTKVTEAHLQQKSLVADVLQRLTWGVGANPMLSEQFTAFERAIAVRENQLDVRQHIITLVLKTSNAVLQYELLRAQTTKAKTYDERFIVCFNKWKLAQELCNNDIQEVITSTEENIMHLYTPDMVDNPKWIARLSENISQVITNTQKKLTELKDNIFITNDGVIISVEKLKTSYTKHCKLMSDVKVLIKSMAKIEECAVNAQQFIVDYRKYLDNFSPILHRFKKVVLESEVEETLKNLIYLEENTASIYESLVKLEANGTVLENNRPPLIRQEGVCISPMKLPIPKQESTAKGQQRNAYAVGVWRRVRMKLEGRDPDPGRKYTVQEQVDYVIREATNIDNLALLYEGWTPWV